jgi:hypothetical protein
MKKIYTNEVIYDLGHMGISFELNSGKIMADIWELPDIVYTILDMIVADLWSELVLWFILLNSSASVVSNKKVSNFPL